MSMKVWYFVLLLGIMIEQKCYGHCDTKDGPVILAAQKALSTGNVNFVLIWVQPKDESIIKEVFKKTLELRKVSPDVQKTIDNYFFETLVRIHRTGEGAAYTGLKDSAEVEIPIAESDEALESGSLTDVMKLLNEMIQKGLSEKFKDAISKRNYDPNNVTAGREYVESYVTFMHYVEGIYNSAKPSEAGYIEHGEQNSSTEHQTSPVAISNQTISANETNEHKTHYLIIGGTLLVIILQIVLIIIRKK